MRVANIKLDLCAQNISSNKNQYAAIELCEILEHEQIQKKKERLLLKSSR